MRITGFDVCGDDLILHTTHEDAVKFAVNNEPFADADYEIKRVRPKRSTLSNSYLWALCSKIADAVGISKEEVYRRNVREGGEYTEMHLKEEEIEKVSKLWSSHGTGWFCEVVDDSDISGRKLVFAYYGSSTYNTKQMSLLIKRVQDDARSVGIVDDYMDPM